MELRLGPRRRSPLLLDLVGGPDLISALPDDVLLLILARLPCASAAARTGVLSRRWRGLWARLRRIVFSDVTLRSLYAALGRFPPPPPAVSLLKICLPEPRGSVPREHRANTACLNWLLRAAALLDPEELLLVLPSCFVRDSLRPELPCFRRATSIVLDLCSNFRRVPAGVEFPALETLSLSRCSSADLAALLPRCPRLRTLRLAKVLYHKGVLSVNSALLQELVVARATRVKHLDIVAPVLTQLTVSLNYYQEVSISIMAPVVEKLSWDCYFSWRPLFGLWRLVQLSLHAAERQRQPPSLHIRACISSSTYHGEEVANFTQEIEKRLIDAFFVLELHLEAKGHVYGAFVSHVLETNPICCAIQRLKMDEEGCPLDCQCEPTDWKSQTITLTALEEVEISGFGEKDHDLDMLKLILRSAPMLKRMTMKLSQKASASNDGCTKIYDIFRVYSSVQCYVYLSSACMRFICQCQHSLHIQRLPLHVMVLTEAVLLPPLRGLRTVAQITHRHDSHPYICRLMG